MNIEVHRAKDRGAGEHGWLSTRYSFSFADWYEPTRMGFGALRVLNDDRIAPASGFPMHPHRDMEIVTIVRKGAVTHGDSMGNAGRVAVGEVQVMSAGTGVVHSEWNASPDESLELFQLWINPDRAGHAPRYAQASFSEKTPAGSMTLLVAPLAAREALGIHQDAYIFRAAAAAGKPLPYRVKNEGNGVYVFVVEGEVEVGGEKLGARDAAGIVGAEEFKLISTSNAEMLLIEVPMG